MRRHLVWLFALASVAVIATAAVAGAASSNTSTAKLNVKPSKLSKKKFKPVKLIVDLSTLRTGDPGTPTHPTLVLSPPTVTNIGLTNDLKFNFKGLATCTAKQLDGTTRTQALAACGKALVSKGTATACAGTAPGAPCLIVVQGQVLGFNAKPKGLVFWTINAVTGETTINAPLKSTSGKFSHTLFGKIPPLGGGSGAITDFDVTLSRTFTHKGKKVHYIEARCPHKKIEIKGTWKYMDGTGNTDVASAKCSG